MTSSFHRSAGLSNPGNVRINNEDVVYIDEERGVFLVVDGVGGHAAGEQAAAIAAEAIRARLEISEGETEDRIRGAITDANNQIYEAASANPEWLGMTCVLTLAVLEGRHVTTGHVGDTRLYRIRHGNIKKITFDHSPVGKQEDCGDLTERQAMEHPCRNEIYRDVGSEPHEPYDSDFIDIVETSVPPDAALLLCSDGLTDLLTSHEILDLIGESGGDPQTTVGALVKAANAAGGRDNISVIFVAGSNFRGPLPPARVRKAITRGLNPAGLAAANIGTESASPAPDPATSLGVGRGRWALSILALVAGVLLGGVAGWRVSFRHAPDGIPRARVINVGKGLAFSAISAALQSAVPGDTVLVSPGDYGAPIVLRSGIRLVSRNRGAATIRNPGSALEAAVAASNIKDARVEGFRIIGDAEHPLNAGMHLSDSDVDVVGVEIAGAEMGIVFDGNCRTQISGSYIHGQSGAGVVMRGPAAPLLSQNLIVNNGSSGKPRRAGLEMSESSHPTLLNNLLSENATDDIQAMPREWLEEFRRTNLFLLSRNPRSVSPVAVLPATAVH